MIRNFLSRRTVANYARYQEDLSRATQQILDIGRDGSLGDLIVPKFWNGVPPISESSFVIDCSDIDMHNVTNAKLQLSHQMRNTFRDLGIVRCQ